MMTCLFALGSERLWFWFCFPSPLTCIPVFEQYTIHDYDDDTDSLALSFARVYSRFLSYWSRGCGSAVSFWC